MIADPPHPSHNHIILCGGIGAWIYESLGGITPVGAGYSTVRIAPEISKSVGPSAVNMTLQTLHGVVRSSWRRTAAGVAANGESEVVRLEVEVPIGVRAQIRVPFLHPDTRTARVVEELRGIELWRSGVAAAPGEAHGGITGSAREVEGGVEVDVGGGRYVLVSLMWAARDVELGCGRTQRPATEPTAWPICIAILPIYDLTGDFAPSQARSLRALQGRVEVSGPNNVNPRHVKRIVGVCGWVVTFRASIWSASASTASTSPRKAAG